MSTQASAKTVMEVKHLRKAFGEKQVLKDISLTLKEGENVVILGKSGTGKSVLIKCIIGLIPADGGELMVLDQQVMEMDNKALDEMRRQVGFLFQSAALYDSMTVRENLEFPLRRNHIPSDEIGSRVEEALDSVGLLEAIDKMPSELSGGMRKRVGVARTLIMQPKIILYDEPTTGLDAITSREISHLVIDIQKKYKTSSLIITHDMACARITADRILVLDEGKFIAEGSYKELENSPDENVRAFFTDHTTYEKAR